VENSDCVDLHGTLHWTLMAMGIEGIPMAVQTHIFAAQPEVMTAVSSYCFGRQRSRWLIFVSVQRSARARAAAYIITARGISMLK